MGFSENAIAELYSKLKAEMSPYRFEHTAGVERAAVLLGELYLPGRIDELRVAALLHDITKELSVEGHIALAKAHNRELSEDELKSPKTLHAITAEMKIGDSFNEFATESVCQAVRYHTTASEDMELFDAIIYIADYIEEGRSFEDCVKLREYFWSKNPASMSFDAREEHLWRTLLLSLEMTVRELTEEGRYVSVVTLRAKTSLEKRLGIIA